MSNPAAVRAVERGALEVAATFAAAAAILACFHPRLLPLAWRLAAFACLAPAVGCTILALIHRTTGGQWAAGLGPFLMAGVALLPWTWVAAMPLLLFAPPSGSGQPGPAPSEFAYDGLAMVAVRALLFGAFFFGLRWALGGDVGRDRDPAQNRRPWLGPAGLIATTFILTLVADDWLESLEAGWHSTGFAVVWMAGQVAAGLSLCLLAGLRAGNRPDRSGAAGRPVGLDWGDLLLTAVMFWTYVAFAQFLIIWSENLPDEISWYLRRQRGAWGWVLPAVLLFGFAIPFFMLLSRRIKASTAGLAWVAGLVLAAQLGYTAWVILPAQTGVSWAGDALAVCLLAAAGGVFINRFARIARLHGGSS